MKNLNSHVIRVKNSMNRAETLNELQRCIERVTDKYHLPTDAWEVWFRGTHLGSIECKAKNAYAVYSSQGRHCGEHSNFMKSLAEFIDSCAVVIARDEIKATEEWVKEVIKEPEIRTWGLREPKSIWQKIKGFFK